ncbi:unnamed protein product [Mycena citricolor]|uniref:RED-like N-terminal domain-containing protein n=1 Tax=Mycena citricolor TaxID=2018698 RepID=A0AAD2HVW3_9AGAR|nr:unnamed protein product [Mycena citricolor]
MDQDAFRHLLTSSGKQTQRSRGSLHAPKTISASEPAFKPRKVKKSDGSYRDRAAERRDGGTNDFAHVEAVLDDFEKRVGDSATDDQRRYLGGDGEHSVLVKGLDFALLEQNKAKASSSTVDDDSLEQAFVSSASQPRPAVDGKRTREEMLSVLKSKRAAAQPTEVIKDSKFKPIGFKPIGIVEEKKKTKKKRVKPDGELATSKSKKKRKIQEIPDEVEPTAVVPNASVPQPPAVVEEDDDADLDIFAGVMEYQGLELDDDDDADVNPLPDRVAHEPEVESSVPPRTWFADEEKPAPPTALVVERQMSLPPADEMEEDEEEDKPARLIPLASSALPSIKEYLAMTGEDGGKKGKGKKKKKKGKKGADDDDDD